MNQSSSRRKWFQTLFDSLKRLGQIEKEENSGNCRWYRKRFSTYASQNVLNGHLCSKVGWKKQNQTGPDDAMGDSEGHAGLLGRTVSGSGQIREANLQQASAEK